MRFGKRNRNPLAMGWRGKPQSDDSEFSPVASEERDALLSPSSFPDEDERPVQLDETRGNTAVQRLTIALGRFERQVTKAMEGAPQEVWSDECMDQLINAVEVAVSEGWTEVVEALTETARILQSYENQGLAHQAVPFLGDTYEVLGVMLGDLLRGRIRPGVMQRWRNRYRLALEELKEAGIPLVRDEEEAEPRTPPKPVAREYEPPKIVAEAEPRRPAGILRSMYRVEPEDNNNGSYDLPQSFTEEEPVFDRQDSYADQPEDSPIDETYDEPGHQQEIEETPSFVDELPPLAPLRSDLFDLDALGTTDADSPQADDAAPAVSGTSPEVIERLDILCEQLSGMERDPEADRVAGFLAVLDSVAFLEEFANKTGRTGCVELCAMMSQMCDSAEAQPGALEDKFFELAYAFCGVYVEADDRADNTMIRSWIAECQTLLSQWETRAQQPAPAEAEAAPTVTDEPQDEPQASPEASTEEPAEAVEAAIESEPVPSEPEVPEVIETEAEAAETPMEAVEPVIEDAAPAEVEAEPPAPAASTDDGPALVTEDSPEALLSVAQQAMSLGRAADAKRMALRAAAMLAQMEVEEASKRVGEAEMRLRQGADLIEQARQQVQEAERRVEEATRSVGSGEDVLAARKSEAEAIAGHVQEIEGRVADLDEQIRQLQLRRDEEARLLEQTRNNLEHARSQEATAGAELENLRKSEEEARIRLEDTRQRVKTLQRRRTEVEAAMERAREHLTRQRLSLAEIQQTLAQVGGRTEDTVDESGEDLLF